MLQARTSNEVRYYMMVTPCPTCGKGPWVLESAQQSQAALTVAARCRGCSHEQSFEFELEHQTPLSGSESETINPTPQPSTLVDLAGWLSLFYMLLERAATEQDRVASRQASYQAALCLAEALKFYGEDELPAESAFFSQASREVFREHPQNFARQRLRDMQGKLPSLGAMARRVERDHWVKSKRWWQLWRR